MGRIIRARISTARMETKLTDLQFKILDGMADDYEDVEQLYLYANRDLAEEEHARVQFPRILVQVRFPLRDIIDEISKMLRQGYIEAKYSNDEEFAPLHPVNVAALHHYWFGATSKGKQCWNGHPGNESPNEWNRLITTIIIAWGLRPS